MSGDNQVAAVGSALADSLVVRVTDDKGNPVAGVEVQWAVGGGGSISPASVSSGADGTAAAERVLGNASGHADGAGLFGRARVGHLHPDGRAGESDLAPARVG